MEYHTIRLCSVCGTRNDFFGHYLCVCVHSLKVWCSLHCSQSCNLRPVKSHAQPTTVVHTQITLLHCTSSRIHVLHLHHLIPPSTSSSPLRPHTPPPPHSSLHLLTPPSTSSPLPPPPHPLSISSLS